MGRCAEERKIEVFWDIQKVISLNVIGPNWF